MRKPKPNGAKAPDDTNASRNSSNGGEESAANVTASRAKGRTEGAVAVVPKAGKAAAVRRPIAIEYRKIASLVPYVRNARTHSPEQVDQIAGSISRFGFVNPVLVGAEDGVLIAGHGRILAARKLGIEDVPTISVAGLSEPQRRALALADNRIALNSGWDAELLRSELEALAEANESTVGLGFDDDELAKLFDEGEALKVEAIETGHVEDRFWISIRGPLEQQAYALKRLQEVMGELPEVEVEMGTTAVDGLTF